MKEQCERSERIFQAEFLEHVFEESQPNELHSETECRHHFRNALTVRLEVRTRVGLGDPCPPNQFSRVIQVVENVFFE